MSMKKNPGVLGDHKRIKKRLVPPLLQIGENRFYSWIKSLIPEYAWISLLMNYHGNKSGVEYAVALGNAARDSYTRKPIPLFAKLSSFNQLTDDEKCFVNQTLAEAGVLLPIQEALSPLSRISSNCPISFLFDKTELTTTLNPQVQSVISDLYDRHSVLATLTQATVAYLGFVQEKIKIAMEKPTPFDNFHEIENYPETEESKKIAASLRAMMGVLDFEEQNDVITERWNNDFWSAVSANGECAIENEIIIREITTEDTFEQIILTYVNNVKQEFMARIDNWHFDLTNIEKYEVLGGLLSRQASLMIDFAYSPNTWTPNASPLFHRAMADVYIVMAWIFKNPQERAIQFIETGIGEIKLQMEHRKRQNEKKAQRESEDDEIIEMYESWIRTQRHVHLTEVNLGSWSGISTRKMAEEADCLDFYNYVYQPFSLGVHPTWSHISMKNMMYCNNKLHRDHRLPTIFEFKIDPHFLYIGAKYWNKSLQLFDEESGLQNMPVISFDQLYSDLFGGHDTSSEE